ncbi:MAG: phosphodiester glycosidase family protein, partial [Bdellovibrionales bacterium]|nr:phosphodiester glycosidase family protein [Bdellovibrionales bacterium]NQZ17996.1 phosphodiester glycosidase family protein [Bdellovibrionales bacterium]
LAINRDGQTLIFYSRRASFDELRYFLKTELDVNEALALDGGNSSSFHALVKGEEGEVNEVNLAHGWLWTPVPYFINFFGN